MKTLLLITVFFIAITTIPLSIFAQGPITPTGTPGATMKSLDQIEARTPISSLPFTINTGGSFYLTKNLSVSSTDGVTINASGVTLDLNGFEISSTEPSPAHSGIVVATNTRNIRISNGSIRGNVAFSGGNTYGGTGFANGIQISGNGVAPMNIHVSDVSISGCLVYGINLGAGLVEACNLSNIGGNGINADTIVNCYVYPCGGIGITANISATGCTAIVTSSSVAIQADMAIACAAQTTPTSGTGTITAEIARDCVAQANVSSAGDAILANTAENCNGFALGSGSGIHCNQSAVNCYGTSSGEGAAAVNVASALNCHGVASGVGGYGISAQSAENCFGFSSSSSGVGDGVSANSAQNCQGSAAFYGVEAGIASGCSGFTSGGSGGAGVRAVSAAIGCYGDGGAHGTGIFTPTASNCVGTTQGTTQGNNYGIDATFFASNCKGFSDSGIGIKTDVAIGCFGSTASGTGLTASIGNSCDGTNLSVTHKYNMP